MRHLNESDSCWKGRTEKGWVSSVAHGHTAIQRGLYGPKHETVKKTTGVFTRLKMALTWIICCPKVKTAIKTNKQTNNYYLPGTRGWRHTDITIVLQELSSSCRIFILHFLWLIIPVCRKPACCNSPITGVKSGAISSYSNLFTLSQLNLRWKSLTYNFWALAAIKKNSEKYYLFSKQPIFTF